VTKYPVTKKFPANIPVLEGSKMRFIAFALAALFATGPAAAEEWQEYSYPDYSFAVAFPAEPKIETTTYQVADGRSVEARVYSVAQDTGVFTMTVADLSGADLAEGDVIDHAIKLLSRSGEIKVDIPHRVRRVYGRQLSIADADGGRVLAAVFYYKDRLYQIEGKSLPAADGTADAIRFQQSLAFTDEATNRPEGASEPAPGAGNRRCRDAANAEGCRRGRQDRTPVPER
jgi:hypothetical protein